MNLGKVFADASAVVGVEDAFVEARSSGMDFSVVGYTDFELKRLLVTDLSFAIRQSGHSHAEAAIVLATQPQVIEGLCRGLVANVAVEGLNHYVQTLAREWHAQIPAFVHEGIRSTAWLVQAQSSSTRQRVS